jgi:biopolymer transport protein TolQ
VTAEISIIDLFMQAGFLVKIVMLTLLGMSVASWTMIIKRSKVLSTARQGQEQFEDSFWSTQDLSQLYQKVKERKEDIAGSEEIFYSGFTEYARLRPPADRPVSRLWKVPAGRCGLP